MELDELKAELLSITTELSCRVTRALEAKDFGTALCACDVVRWALGELSYLDRSRTARK
jgi:hypothetical protein